MRAGAAAAISISISISISLALVACGGSDPDPGPDPGPADPQFVDGENRITIAEGEWRGVGDGWAGVSAWFSDAPSFQTESARAGACRLMVSDTMYCEGCEGFCVSGVCTEWPVGRSAGTITITGMAGVSPLTLTWMDSYYSNSPQPPRDMFDPGDAISVTAAGDAVAGFAASVTGVEEIDPDLVGACGNEMRLVRGEDKRVTWSDPVAGARVYLRLPSPNNGHGMPPRAVIECEGPDTGQLTVPAALIDGLPDLADTDACDGVACVGVDCPPSSLARYTRTVVPAGDETVVVRVENEVDFYLFD
jgi:hypothetical protein